MDLRVISIGTLPFHPLWNERAPLRTGHATTTLIRAGRANILVDPGLPAQILAARLNERSGLLPADITHVFLTSFQLEAARGIAAFEKAEWLIAPAEREQVGVPLALKLKHAHDEGEDELVAELQRQVAILQRCKPAEDSLVKHVDLFPMPGVTPGACGLIVSERRHTILVCGDAVPTIEHLEQGVVLPHCVNTDLAKESLMEAVEIADVMVLGRDNIVVNPVRRGPAGPELE